MATAQIPEGRPLNGYGLPDMRFWTPEEWLQMGSKYYCPICSRHPGENRGLDCPHGHWVTRERFQAQEHFRRRQLLVFAVLALVPVFFLPTGLSIGLWAFAEIAILIYWRITTRVWNTVWLRFAQHPEVVEGYWERTKRLNHPWNTNYFA